MLDAIIAELTDLRSKANESFAKNVKLDFTLSTLSNMGHDTSCGACMSRAFSGSDAGYTHDCKSTEVPVVAGVDRAGLEADIDAVRKCLPVSGKRWATSHDALDRIEEALGVKEPT